MYSHDKMLSKCNLFYTPHLVPECHKCSIVGPFMVHDNFKIRKLCCVTFLQIVKHKLYVFVGQKPFLPDDFTAPKSVRNFWLDVLESLKYLSAWKTKAIYFMYQTAQDVVIQYMHFWSVSWGSSFLQKSSDWKWKEIGFYWSINLQYQS